MTQLFHITGEPDGVPQQDVLLMEIGEDYSCFAKGNAAAKNLQELRYYSFKRFAFEALNDIWAAAKENGAAYEKVVVCSALPQALLVPDKFYEEAAASDLLQAVYPVQQNIIMHDAVNMWKLYNVYAVPSQLHQINAQHYANIEYIHAYSAALRTYNSVTADHQLFVQFAVSTFRVKVKKEQKLVLMQTFSFQSPLDVVYVLLKICTEMGLQQEETPVTLSGLIDADSDMYKELYHYFLHLRFASFADHFTLQTSYPSHFFASLYNLAACVL